MIQRVLAIPPKRFDRHLVTYLTEPETVALLAAPDTDTLTGRRDHALLGAYETPIDKMLSLLPQRVTLELVPDQGAEPRPDGL